MNYIQFIKNLFPEGKIWENKTTEALAASVAPTVKELDEKFNRIPKGIDPRNHNYLLDEWEEALGIEESDLTIDQRKRQAFVKYTRSRSQSKETLINLLKNISGAENVEIQKLWPLRAGEAKAGDSLRGDPYKYLVFITGVKETPLIRRQVEEAFHAHVAIYFTDELILREQEFILRADDPEGILINNMPSSLLSIEASGSITHETDRVSNGPEGPLEANKYFRDTAISSDISIGTLLINTESQLNKQIIPYTSGIETRITSGSNLRIVVNDDSFEDNTGDISIKIRIKPWIELMFQGR